MSQKNTKENKQLRRLERALRKGRTPSLINLVHWLEDHGHADTAGQAKKIVMDKRVKVDSHPLGVRSIDLPAEEGQEPEKQDVFDPFVPADLRDRIEVVAA